MSTPTDTPASQEVRRKEKSKKKEKDKSHKKEEFKSTSVENDFSEMLLASSTPPTPQVNGNSREDKSEKKNKKRHREDAQDTNTSVDREESPRKKKKDGHEKESPLTNGVDSFQTIAMDILQRSSHKKNRAHTSSDSLMKQLLKAKKKDRPDGIVDLEKATPSKATPTLEAPSKKEKKKSKKRKSEAENRSEDHVLDSSLPQESLPQIDIEENVPVARQALSDAEHQPSKPISMEGLESPFHTVNVSFKVTVPPVAQSYPLEGVLAEYISPLLLTYHPQLDGILMSFNNARLSTLPPDPSRQLDKGLPLAQAVDECAAPYIWLTLDVLLFKPKKGVEMDGFVNLQNESHISLILWNLFTVSIERKHLPKDWVWHDFYDENGENNDASDKPMRRSNEKWGVWYDGQGYEVQGALRFRIKDWDCAPPGPSGEGSFLSIDGSMLTPEEDKELEDEEAEDARRQREASATRRIRRNGTSLVSALRRSSTPAVPPAVQEIVETSAPSSSAMTDTPIPSSKKAKKSKNKD